MTKRSKNGKVIPLRGAPASKPRNVDGTPEGVSMVSRYAVRPFFQDGRAVKDLGAELTVVIGISMGTDSTCHISEYDGHLIFDENRLSSAMIMADLNTFWTEDDAKDAISALVPLKEEDIEDADWRVFVTPEELVSTIRSLDLASNISDEDVQSFSAGLASWLNAVHQIAFSTYVTSGVTLTGGSFKPLVASMPQGGSSSKTSVPNPQRGEEEKRQPDSGANAS